MLRHEKYFSLCTQTEWLKASTLPADYVTGVPAVDKFAYDSATESLHLNSSAAKAHHFQYITDTLKVGDVIEVECEFANISGGYGGKIDIIDRIDKNTKLEFVSENMEPNFKRTKLRYVVIREAQYDILVGINGGNAGEVKLRNFRVKTYSTYADTRQYVETKNTRKAFLEGNASLPNKFTVRNDYASDSATINTNASQVQIIWTVPFEGTKKPICVASLEASAKNYIVRVTASSVNSVYLQFHNLTTGEVVPIANLDLSTSIHLSVIGMT